MLQRHTTKPQTLRFHLTHPCIELCRNSSPSHIPLLNFAGAALHITPRMCANPEPRSERISTKPQTLRFLSHTSLFWTLPNSSPCYTTHVSQPILNQRPKTHYKLQSENVHLTHPCFELCLNNSEQMTPRMCANPSWTNIPKTHHKTSDPKVFISHIPVLNFAGAALHITPRMCANPSWANVPKHTTNFRSENFHLTHPCFELCLNNSEQMTPRMCANPEPMLQRHTTKPQTLRFSSHTSLFWTLPEQLSILHHAYVPIHPEPTSQNTLQISIRKFSSHTSLFWTLPEQLGTDYTTHVCQPWTNVTKTHHKTSDPKIFISHIPVLNFAGTALHITPRMCANPSWRHTTKSQTPRFSSHTSLFWTLPEQLSILHHACVPTLSQRRKELPQNLRP